MSTIQDSIDPQHVDPMMKMFKKYVIDYISDRNQCCPKRFSIKTKKGSKAKVE